MLTSILDRPYQRIKVDRLLTIDNGVPTLYTSPEDVLHTASTQYEAFLSSRKHRFDNIPTEWQEIYDPLSDIDETIYQSLMDMPTPSEWQTALNKASNNTAPGVSGIGY